MVRKHQKNTINELLNDTKQYEVEAITNKSKFRFGNKKLQWLYHIKWKGFPKKEMTWEPKQNLKCKKLLQKFESSWKNHQAIKNYKLQTKIKKKLRFTESKKLILKQKVRKCEATLNEQQKSMKCEKIQNICHVLTYATPEEYKKLNNDFLRQLKLKIINFKRKENEKIETTISYSLPTFNAICNYPYLRSVIKLVGFRNHIYASFSDFSVRRYHIENQNANIFKDYIKFNGHFAIVTVLKVLTLKSVDFEELYLITGSDDNYLRQFNANTGEIIKNINLNSCICCIDYCWSTLFVGLKDGSIIKLSSVFNKNLRKNYDYNEIFQVELNKKIKSIQSAPTLNNKLHPLIVVTAKLVLIINTKLNRKKSNCLMYLLNLNYNSHLPITLNVFGKYVFLTFNYSGILKSGEYCLTKEVSNLHVYDLNNFENPYRQTEIIGVLTTLNFLKNEFILTSFTGEIRCYDIDKFELKWITYYKGAITSALLFEKSIVVGDNNGTIANISLNYDSLNECKFCFVNFLRFQDLKKHISREHDKNV